MHCHTSKTSAKCINPLNHTLSFIYINQKRIKHILVTIFTSNDVFIVDLSWRHTSGRQPKHDAANLWRGGMVKTNSKLVQY